MNEIFSMTIASAPKVFLWGNEHPFNQII